MSHVTNLSSPLIPGQLGWCQPAPHNPSSLLPIIQAHSDRTHRPGGKKNTFLVVEAIIVSSSFNNISFDSSLKICFVLLVDSLAASGASVCLSAAT